MSTVLQGAELNYSAIDKQAYVVFKAVKQFRPYILKNRTKVIIPHPAVRSLFVQKELGERRGNWVIALQEYDLEFKPSSIVKGKGLCKLMTENRNNEEHAWENETELHLMDVCPLFIAPDSWYRDLVHYLQTGSLPEHWNSKKRRALRLKSASYQIIEGILFKKNYDRVLLRCLEKEDAKKVMTELHDGPAGGHFLGDTTTHKILEPDTIGPRFSKMHTPMSGSATFVKGVVEDNLRQPHH